MNSVESNCCKKTNVISSKFLKWAKCLGYNREVEAFCWCHLFIVVNWCDLCLLFIQTWLKLVTGLSWLYEIGYLQSSFSMFIHRLQLLFKFSLTMLYINLHLLVHSTKLSSSPFKRFLSLSNNSPPQLQEEESPDNGELRRADSSPTPLKRDRSFSEHDLALLRGEMLPSLSESTQLDGVIRLRGERTQSRPPPNYRGQCENVKIKNVHITCKISSYLQCTSFRSKMLVVKFILTIPAPQFPQVILIIVGGFWLFDSVNL